MDPRRAIIADVVSALRRLTLEPVQADDVFELTVEESGAWRRARAKLLVERKKADAGARKFVREELRRLADSAQWPERIAARRELHVESIVRVLVLEAREAADESPPLSAALALTATTIGARLPAEDAFGKHLVGCAWLAYGNALRHTGDYPQALTALDAAEREFTRHVISANELAQEWYVRGAILWKRGEFDVAFRLCRRAAILFEVLGDERRVVFTRILEASIAFEQGDAADARDILAPLIAPLEALGDKRTLASVEHSLGTAEGKLGNITPAKIWFKRAAALFERLHVKTELVRVRWCLGYFIGIHEDRTRGLEFMREAQRAFESFGMAMDAGFVGLDLAEVLLLAPDGADEAAEVCRRVYALFQRAGAGRSAAQALAYLREAAQKRTASTELVGSVRTYLRALERNPHAVFVPETRQ